MLMPSVTSVVAAGAALFASVPMVGDNADKVLQVVMVVLTVVQIILFGIGG